MYGPPYTAAQVKLDDGLVENLIAIGAPEDLEIYKDIFPGYVLVDANNEATMWGIYNFEDGTFTRAPDPEGSEENTE